MINSPSHYWFPVQPIDYVKPIVAEMDGFEGACTKDIVKYISRWHRKNGIEDVKKAKRYAEMLIEYLEEKEARRLAIERLEDNNEKSTIPF